MPYLTGQVLTQADIAALFASGTYTPTLGAMAVGTGGTPTNSAKYTFVGFPAGGVLTVEGKIKFGTTSVTLPGASTETISLPSGYALIDTSGSSVFPAGVSYTDVSAGQSWSGLLAPNSSTTVVLYVPVVSGTMLVTSLVSGTVPFTWAINDEIYYRFTARCTGP